MRCGTSKVTRDFDKSGPSFRNIEDSVKPNSAMGKFDCNEGDLQPAMSLYLTSSFSLEPFRSCNRT